jgi:hypothetical protein
MTECQCGRDKNKLHCPFCGYAGIAGQAKLTREVDGITIYSYRCRKCARVFDDLSKERCVAPHWSSTHAKKLEDKMKPISPDKLPDWMKEVMRKRGIKPKEPSVADEIDSKLEEKETES